MTNVASEGRKEALEAERSVARPSNLRASWEALFEDARSCTRCDLYKHATQTVFGEGPLDAKLMFVAEQPGDAEDLAGRPFVGPAGQLFDSLLEKAGVDRSQTYVTNAVKHFKFEHRSKRRIHQKPTAGEVKHYRWWLDQELKLVHPRLVVALGATAVLALAGNASDRPMPRSRRSYAEALSRCIPLICSASRIGKPGTRHTSISSAICAASGSWPPSHARREIRVSLSAGDEFFLEGELSGFLGVVPQGRCGAH